MVNETKYRKQAMQAWELSREETVEELRAEAVKWSKLLHQLMRALKNAVTFSFTTKRHL
ncbi:hypothetical protein [Paenibacillus turpanensis]|uniref:hypothetical protein n=1 Tax=Paenibacillus turpanensis TaxID=2689078 RepID=UPI00140BB7CE|nr:hypothetical protein [Paenibacillus turpanensis]